MALRFCFIFYRQLQATVKDLDDAHKQLNKRDSKISQLENEVYVYQENYRLLTNQLREVEQVNMELKQQVCYFYD